MYHCDLYPDWRPSFGLFANKQKAALSEEIRNFDTERVLNSSSEDLFQYFIEKYRIDPIEIKIGERYLKDQPKEEEREGVADRHHYPFDGFKNRYKVLTFTICIPFTGDPVVLCNTPYTDTQLEESIGLLAKEM